MKVKPILTILFTLILLTMIAVTSLSSLRVPLWNSVDEFTWVRSPWAVATLFDAYFGFLTFFVWVAYKERSAASRILWLVLIMAFGNIAMASYILLQLPRLKPEDGLEKLLLRDHAHLS
jgi:hypothetical protein